MSDFVSFVEDASINDLLTYVHRLTGTIIITTIPGERIVGDGCKGSEP
jgi:hypothetical protein